MNLNFIKSIILTFAFIIYFSNGFTQTPQGFSYQAVLRDGNGTIKANSNVVIIVDLIQGSINGPVAFTETHSTSTNSFGLVTLNIGSANQPDFNAINWANGPFFIRITIDGAIMGTSQLLSVPYALFAKTAENGFSGNYNDLSNKPNIFDGNYNNLTDKPILFSGNYNDLSNKPSLFDGTWSSLDGKPSFAIIATSGNYEDLLNKPSIFSGSYNDLTNKPSLFDGTWTSLTGKPPLSSVATTGSYYDLQNKPVLFDGSWSSLTEKPIFASVAVSGSYTDLLNKPSLFSGSYNDLTNKPSLFDGTWTSLTGKPTLSLVATTGSYNDLQNKPTLFDGSWDSLSGKPNLATVATSGSYNDLSNKPTGNNPGDIQYWDGTKWVNIAAGTKGQILTMNSSGNPMWTDLFAEPTATTENATTINTTTATLNGLVNPNGLVTSVVFEYGPTVSYGSSVSATQSIIKGFASTNISIEISGLQVNSTYHFRIKAENSLGIAYGSDKTFTTPKIEPIITFNDITKNYGDSDFELTNPTSNSCGEFIYSCDNSSVATINGKMITIIGAGTAKITASQADCGNYFAGNATATLTVNRIDPVFSNFGDITKNYCDDQFYITAPTSTSDGMFNYSINSNQSTATLYGNKVTITNAGTCSITAFQCPTNNYNAKSVTVTLTVNPCIPNISNISNITKNFGDGLFLFPLPVSNSDGTISYNNSNTSVVTLNNRQVTIVGAGSTTITVNQSATQNFTAGSASFTITVNPIAPTISNFTNITKTYGDSPFSLTPPTSNSSGTFSYSSSNTSVATISGSTVTIVGSGISTITATQTATTNYTSGTISLTLTVNGVLPTVSTSAVTTFSNTSASVDGSISNGGGSTVTARGICYSTTQNPTTTDNHTSEGTGTGSFTSNLTDLTQSTTYYARAYATNSVGTNYGNQVSFTTSGPPIVTTSAATNIISSSVTLNGTINANNLSSTVTFEYGTSTSYGSSVTATQSPVSGNTNISVSANITGLTIGTKYHFRVKAVSSQGTSYGNDVTFTYLYYGASWAGGLVFNIDGTGEHGLVCATTDQSTNAPWGCNGTTITGADGLTVGTGNQNTIDIEAGCTTPGTAADICANLVLNGYSDWYLPSMDELGLMYNRLKKNGLGNFSDIYYWSSSEMDYRYAYHCLFLNGDYRSDLKDVTNHYTRAIRSF